MSDPDMLCYHGFVVGRVCGMVMMAEGAGRTSALSLVPNFKIGKCRGLHNKKGKIHERRGQIWKIHGRRGQI